MIVAVLRFKFNFLDSQEIDDGPDDADQAAANDDDDLHWVRKGRRTSRTSRGLEMTEPVVYSNHFEEILL